MEKLYLFNVYTFANLYVGPHMVYHGYPIYIKYLYIFFYYNTRITPQLEGIFNEGLRKVLNNQLSLFLWVTSHQFFFFIGFQNRFTY